MIRLSDSLNSSHYVPILRSKQGEMWALDKSRTRNTVPLLQIMDLEKAQRSVPASWPATKGAIWLQALNVEEVDYGDFAHGFENLFIDLRGSVEALPVLSVGDADEMVEVVGRLARKFSDGLVIRLDVTDAIENQNTINDVLDSILVELGESRESTHLVIDAGLIEGEPIFKSSLTELAMRALEDLVSWKSIVVAQAAFPDSLAGFPLESISSVPRSDITAYESVKQNFPDIEIAFGDYTVGTPTLDSAQFLPIPNIKYAMETEWKVLRGRERDRQRTEQYRALALRLVGQEWFKGSDFSAGDHFWSDVAGEVVQPGNPATAVRAAVSHHIALMDYQLSTPDES